MRICAIMKYPPIQGGVSVQCFWWARGMADLGHEVFVVTNAEEVEDNYRIQLTGDDRQWLEYESESGGFVRLFNPEPFSVRLTHIPQSNPFVSKLASIATDVIRRYRCEAIFTYYLEPYGMAAYLASNWTGIPYLCHHAGSDLGRLMNQPDLGTAYREVFRAADGLCCRSAYSFIGLGVDPEAIYIDPSFYLPRTHFNPETEALDLNVHLGEMAEQCPDLVTNTSPLDFSLPTIGIYGKMGVLKGSYDLLAALSQLRQEGRKFNFVAMTRGREMERYLEAVGEHGLEDTAWIFPFIPHWKVARFVRACDAVCFLERDFPIKFHAPTIPAEILSCGTCLILSGEIAAKQSFKDDMQTGKNFLLVPDPKKHEELADAIRQVIENPKKARKIGLRGSKLVEGSRQHRVIVEQYEAILKDIQGRRQGQEGSFSPKDKGLPETRRDAIGHLAPAVQIALEDEADRLLEAYLEESEDPRSPIKDVAGWLQFLRDRHSEGMSETLSDSIRFAELTIWQLSIDDKDGVKESMFPRQPDLILDNSNALKPEAWASMAPLRSNWLRWEQFTSLPRRSREGAPSGPQGQILVFHRQPNLNGRHFQVTPAAAMLLERCDGTRSVREIVKEFEQQAGNPGVARPIMAMLRQFFREGMIILVEPEKEKTPQGEAMAPA